MASKSNLRITIDAGGIPRSIISIGEHKSTGKLTIRIKAAARMRDVGRPIYAAALSSSHMLSVVSQKYSIHPSLMSESGNQIHHTLVVEGHDDFNNYHWTKAIKTTNKFALLFGRSHPDLRSNRYAVEGSQSINYSLGKYDPENYTLVTFVAVSQKGRKFEQPHRIFNVFQRDFTRFSIVLLWGFITVGSTENGSLHHVQTERLENESDPDKRVMFEQTMEGFDETQCLVNCQHIFNDLRDDLSATNPLLAYSRGPGFSFSGEWDDF